MLTVDVSQGGCPFESTSMGVHCLARVCASALCVRFVEDGIERVVDGSCLSFVLLEFRHEVRANVRVGEILVMNAHQISETRRR